MNLVKFVLHCVHEALWLKHKFYQNRWPEIFLKEFKFWKKWIKRHVYQFFLTGRCFLIFNIFSYIIRSSIYCTKTSRKFWGRRFMEDRNDTIVQQPIPPIRTLQWHGSVTSENYGWHMYPIYFHGYHLRFKCIKILRLWINSVV